MTSQKAFGEPDPRPEPVKVAGQIAAAINAIAGALAVIGVITVSASDRVNTATAAILVAVPPVVGAIAVVWATFRARNKVTPLESPRDNDGTPLVRAA